MKRKTIGPKEAGVQAPDGVGAIRCRKRCLGPLRTLGGKTTSVRPWTVTLTSHHSISLTLFDPCYPTELLSTSHRLGSQHRGRFDISRFTSWHSRPSGE